MTVVTSSVGSSDRYAVNDQQRAPSEFTGSDRRRSPRLDVVVPVDGRLLPMDVQLQLLNISEGGFLMQSPTEFPAAAIREFRFTTRDSDEPLVLRGRIVHTMRTTTADTVAYMIGVAFIDDGTAAHIQMVQRLIGAVQR